MISIAYSGACFSVSDTSALSDSAPRLHEPGAAFHAAKVIDQAVIDGVIVVPEGVILNVEEDGMASLIVTIKFPGFSHLTLTGDEIWYGTLLGLDPADAADNGGLSQERTAKLLSGIVAAANSLLDEITS